MFQRRRGSGAASSAGPSSASSSCLSSGPTAAAASRGVASLLVRSCVVGLVALCVCTAFWMAPAAGGAGEGARKRGERGKREATGRWEACGLTVG